MMITFDVLGTFVFLVHLTHAWDNDWDGYMHKECRRGDVFTSVYSEHKNSREDRRYTWYCSHRSVFTGEYGSCYWTGYLNHFDRPVDFTCPSGYAVTGVTSYHDNGREDRRFKFKCCRPPMSKTCSTETPSITGFVNDWDKRLSWKTGLAMIGAYSVHDNRREDRRWKFRTGYIKCRDRCYCPRVATKDWYVEEVQYNVNKHKKSSVPEVLSTKIIDNTQSSSKASISFSFSKSKSSSYSFSHESGTDLGVTMSFTAGLPFLSTSIGTTVGISKKQSRTKENTVTKQFTSTFQMEVDSGAHVKAEAIVQQDKLDVPYTMRLKHRTLGCTCMSAGTWKGVDFYNLRMKVVDQTVRKREDMKIGSEKEVDHRTEKCTNGTKGWDCESNGVHFYGFDAFNFPSTEVPEKPKWTTKTKAACLDSCHGEGDCAGVVRETDLGDDDTGNCYLITSDSVNYCKVSKDTDDDKKFTIWLAHGIEQFCYEPPTTN